MQTVEQQTLNAENTYYEDTVFDLNNNINSMLSNNFTHLKLSQRQKCPAPSILYCCNIIKIVYQWLSLIPTTSSNEFTITVHQFQPNTLTVKQ